MSPRSRSIATAAAALLAACATSTAPDGANGHAPAAGIHSIASLAASNAGARTDAAPALAVRLRDAGGAEIGFARLHEDGTGRVHLTVHAAGLTPGLHGMHLHAVGVCDGGAGFGSAGGHFNPAGRQHGHHNPNGHHAGDLPNLVVNPAGVGRLAVVLEQFRLADLRDANGTALVLHEREDDLTTDNGAFGPGNSGPRIACGVLQAD